MKEKELLEKIKKFGIELEKMDDVISDTPIPFDFVTSIETMKNLSKEIEPEFLGMIGCFSTHRLNVKIFEKINNTLHFFSDFFKYTDELGMDEEQFKLYYIPYLDDMDFLTCIDTLYYYYGLLESSIERYIEDEENPD